MADPTMPLSAPLSFRLPVRLLEQIDAIAERRTRAAAAAGAYGPKHTRTSVVLELLARGVAAELAPSKRKAAAR
jgi:hypothetical protein